MNPPLTQEKMEQFILAAGLSGSIVCFHSSYKSFGPVLGGPIAVVQAFLNSRCTLVVPTFTYDSAVPKPAGRLIRRNGNDDVLPLDPEKVVPFDWAGKRISADMGAIPATVLGMKDSVRGDHPINSLTSIGRQAKEIAIEQSFLNVYGSYKFAYAQENAFLILAGVGLTKATPVHYAEERAGRRLFRQWAKISDGSVVEVEVGSCSDGFDNLDASVAIIEQRVFVGNSLWRIIPFKAFIDTATLAIKQNPAVTHCPDPGCLRCSDAVQGGPILE